MSDTGDSRDNPETDIERVLRAVGTRARPSSSVEREVHAAVYAEWRSTLARRGRRRRMIVGSIAAGIGAVIVAGFLAERQKAPQEQNQNKELMSGDRYMALTYPGNVSVRLDRQTLVMQKGARDLQLLSGAVYVDAGATHDARTFLRIETPAGTLSHLGTQYEVRLLAGDTRIRVREGSVMLTGAVKAIIEASEQVTVGIDGRTARARIAADSSEWEWTQSAAPPFEIDGQTVQAFLIWVGRELGCEITYATPAARAEALRTVLRGSTAGLAPAAALAAVLPTTKLRGSRRDGQLLIELQ